MPGIRDTKKIDLIARTKEGNPLLVLVEDGPWLADEEHVRLLIEKLNNYLGYILDGQLKTMYPDLAGKPVYVKITSFHDFDEITKKIFDQLTADMKEKYSITLQFERMER